MMREKMLKGLIDHLMSMPDKSEHMTDHADMMGNKDALDSGIVGDEMNAMRHGEPDADDMPTGHPQAEITAIKVEKKPTTHGAFPMQKNHFSMGHKK